jgi:hypothetical protein
VSRLRIINLGLPKTGTTTLARALRRGGLNVADWRVRDRQTARDDIRGELLGRIMYADYFATGDPLARLDEFDAVTEMNALRLDTNFWPQTDWGFLSAIEDKHPGAVFLLSYRDPDQTAASMMNWRNLGEKRLPQNAIPGLPIGYGGNAAEISRWIEGHYTFCRRVFAGRENFMEYNVADPEVQRKLGAFLGIDLPWWGQANQRRADAAEVID